MVLTTNERFVYSKPSRHLSVSHTHTVCWYSGICTLQRRSVISVSVYWILNVRFFGLQYQRWISHCVLNITTDIAAGRSMNGTWYVCLFFSERKPYFDCFGHTSSDTLASCDQWIIGLRNVCRGMCVKHHQLERPCVAHSLTRIWEAPVMVSSATLSFYEAFFEKTLKILFCLLILIGNNVCFANFCFFDCIGFLLENTLQLLYSLKWKICRGQYYICVTSYNVSLVIDSETCINYENEWKVKNIKNAL